MPKQGKISAVITWLVFIILILVSASYLIIVANGYKINYKNFHLTKTGMIYVKSDPKDVNIYVNNQYKSAMTPYRDANIDPGRYDVKITKTGYNDWTKTFVVSEGMISSEDNIILFKSQPEQLATTQSEKDNFNELVSQWPPVGLKVKNEGEIWFEDVLVTRFSQPVKAVAWYKNLKHIIFQIDKEIRLIGPDGSNNIKLARLSSDAATQFIPYDNGNSLLYKDSNEIKKIGIK